MSDVYDPDVEHELNTRYTGETRMRCPCGHGEEPWHYPYGGICTVGWNMSMTNQQQFLCEICHDPACACSARGLTASQYKALKEIVHPAAGSWNAPPTGEPIAADVIQMMREAITGGPDYVTPDLLQKAIDIIEAEHATDIVDLVRQITSERARAEKAEALLQNEHLITQSLRAIVEQQRVMLLKAEADLKRTEPDIGSDVPGGGAI
jgi:hypothetical protein